MKSPVVTGIKLARKPNQLSALYIKGSIDHSLVKIFGDIGGQTEVDLLKFDEQRRRIILRVPKEFYVKLRAAITCIGDFQGVPCNFQVKKVSPLLLTLVETHLDFASATVV
uniref:Uncharacterized protein n=1 Tax=Anopheles culicifacies TaxID=139723 RepID=A0A182MUI7_9DIPT